MATILITSTFGSDDPTRATFPFLSSQAFLDKGHDVGLALLGEGTYLMKDSIRDQVKGVGWPPLSEVMPKAILEGMKLYIWGGCAVARGVTEEDLEGKNAKFVTPDDYVDLTMAADKMVNT